jgi:hypothetical protein
MCCVVWSSYLGHVKVVFVAHGLSRGVVLVGLATARVTARHAAKVSNLHCERCVDENRPSAELAVDVAEANGGVGHEVLHALSNFEARLEKSKVLQWLAPRVLVEHAAERAKLHPWEHGNAREHRLRVFDKADQPKDVGVLEAVREPHLCSKRLFDGLVLLVGPLLNDLPVKLTRVDLRDADSVRGHAEDNRSRHCVLLVEDALVNVGVLGEAFATRCCCVGLVVLNVDVGNILEERDVFLSNDPRGVATHDCCVGARERKGVDLRVDDLCASNEIKTTNKREPTWEEVK